MRARRSLSVVLAFTLAGVAVALATPGAVASPASPVESAPSAADIPRIVELYPNPVAHTDRGEYVVVSISGGGNWTLTDGERTVRLPSNRTGRYAVSADPDAAERLVSVPVVERDPGVRLADAGERLELRRNGQIVDAVEYERAPEGERWLRNVDGRWRPRGYRPRDASAHGGAPVRMFVLPDAPGEVTDALDGAEDRVLLAAYTFESERVVDRLLAAERRGAEVRVLVEGAPVGGQTRRQAAALDRLASGGVEVRVLTGDRARYSFHHAKYAVVDDRVLVLTENWKPSGTGGGSNRGWGVVVERESVADDLAAVFARDAGWLDSVPWSEFRAGRTFRAAAAADGSYPARRPPATARAERVELLTAPGNAESRVVELLDSAEREVVVVQPRVGGAEQRLVRATFRAADRGVDVRILLSGAWYDAEENRAFAAAANRRAEAAGWSLEVRVADPRGRYGKIHAKGVVVDDRVVVGSMNWNDHSARENREVAVLLVGEEVADYYRKAFDADWRLYDPRLPVGLLVAAGAGVAAAAGVARRKVAFA